MIQRSTIRPIAAYALHSVTQLGKFLLSLDPVRGYLLQIDCLTDNTTIVNPHHTQLFQDATGLAIAGDTLWLTLGNNVYRFPGAVQQTAPSPTLIAEKLQNPQLFVNLVYPADGIAVNGSTIYITSQKAGYILIFDALTTREITRFPAPGVGIENITIRDEELWLCDTTEQSVYCLDRATGEIQFSVLTPFENPTGLAFYSPTPEEDPILYVAYAGVESYLRDNPNAVPNLELAMRDRTFIHPLYFRYYPDQAYALSNGYQLEMVYVEELQPLEEVDLKGLEWRIALPTETHRQKIIAVEAIGLPFTEEIQDGQRVACFRFDTLQPGERQIFGWKVILEVWSIKYRLTPRQVEKLPPLPEEIQNRYLQDDDDLAMETREIQDAAREANGTETNLLRKVFKIRNYVYDRLSYGIKPYIDTPDVVLQRGVGSCGEYLGVLLALCRLNGIPCRTVGRYKCPPYADRFLVPLQPDFNHVWMEFYIPGKGWVPMESNPDDVQERGPYPSRFFMGLAWYHIEIGKGISFETLRIQNEAPNQEEVSLGSLALNHVRFRILQELQP